MLGKMQYEDPSNNGHTSPAWQLIIYTRLGLETTATVSLQHMQTNNEFHSVIQTFTLFPFNSTVFIKNFIFS